MIGDDIRRYNIKGVLATIWLYLRSPGFKAIVHFRLAQWLMRCRIPVLPSLLYVRCMSKTAGDISPWAQIGPGFHIPHPAGVVIGHGAKIGSNFFILSGAVIGQKNADEWPVIEDDVHVMAGAKVLGAVRLGSGCTVGANAVVLHDVAAGETVVGAPARPIVRKAKPQEGDL